MYLPLDATGTRYAQLARALKQAILEGRLVPGSKLPSTRALAEDTGLSRNTVLLAYELLRAERLGVARAGSGTYVTDAKPLPATPALALAPTDVAPQSAYATRLRTLGPVVLAGGPSHRLRYDLQYGAPLLNPPLVNAWSTALARAALRTDTRYPPAQGLASLRQAICHFLARWRGVVAQPQDVVIVSGAQQALSLVARIVLDAGATAAIEDPHYQLAAHALRAHGADVASVPTDAQGLVVDALPPAARLVHVTPSHQFPSGRVMSLERRMALLQFAAQRDAWIFEDDYDGELSDDASSSPALRALDRHDRVVYVGSFSKMMFPSLRLGYVVCPRGLRDDLVAAKQMDDLGSGAIEQAAMASLFDKGAFERHLRLAVGELRKRRGALLAGLARHAGDHIQVADSRRGMHVVGWLPHWDDARLAALIEVARTQGVGLHSIRPHYRTPPPQPGLLLGFAGLSPRQLEAATKVLGQCLRDAR